MTSAEKGPLLLLDVDGPLNPYAAKPERRPPGYLTHRLRPASWVASDPSGWPRPTKPLRVWLNPTHGPKLLALPYTLVWATSWMDEANEWIAPRLGLPPLPVIIWPQMRDTDPEGVHWKTRHVVEWAVGRAFAWIDDEINDRDRAWVAEHHRGPALLHWVDARHGLRDDDFGVMTSWAQQTEAGPRT
jgi:hypothetical protein